MALKGDKYPVANRHFLEFEFLDVWDSYMASWEATISGNHFPWPNQSTRAVDLLAAIPVSRYFASLPSCGNLRRGRLADLITKQPLQRTFQCP